MTPQSATGDDFDDGFDDGGVGDAERETVPIVVVEIDDDDRG